MKRPYRLIFVYFTHPQHYANKNQWQESKFNYLHYLSHRVPGLLVHTRRQSYLLYNKT